jgi:hypothetical protein
VAAAEGESKAGKDKYDMALKDYLMGQKTAPDDPACYHAMMRVQAKMMPGVVLHCGPSLELQMTQIAN